MFDYAVNTPLTYNIRLERNLWHKPHSNCRPSLPLHLHLHGHSKINANKLKHRDIDQVSLTALMQLMHTGYEVARDFLQ